MLWEKKAKQNKTTPGKSSHYFIQEKNIYVMPQLKTHTYKNASRELTNYCVRIENIRNIGL